ncbi:MAG: F0F1 ATP synthase subunit B [Gemmatimonadaceae bacterium]
MHLLLLLQESAPEAANGSSLLSPNAGLMVWTLLIFLAVWFILSRFAFPEITEAVRAREQALQEAIDGAQRDREEAARLLEDQREQIASARDEAQKIIGEARNAGERVRTEMIDQTHAQQAELLERARREIGAERDTAIADLRREAVDLAIAGASRVISKNLDDQTNRQLVESFLASIPNEKIAPKAGA